MDDGSAEARAVERLRNRQGELRERVGRVESLVFEVEIEIAVEGVGSASADHVDVSSERTSELCLSAGSDYL